MTCNIYLLLLLFIQQTVCSGQFSTLPSSTTVAVGGNASFECTASSGGQVTWDIHRGINVITRIGSNVSNISVLDVDRALLLGPLDSSLVLEGIGQGMDGVAVVCLTVIGLNVVAQDEPFAILSVLFPPGYSIDPSQSTAVVEGANEYTYRFMLTANPIPAVFTWMKGSAELSSTSRIVLTVDSITIRDVLRSDAGLYTVSTGASATANFTLDVQYPPSFGSEKNASQTVVEGATLTIDCTPTPGNPSSTNVTFRVDTTDVNQSDSSVSISSNSNMLAISPVLRRHSGTYSCTASNEVGQDPIVIIPVTVNAPPSVVFSGSYQAKEGENFVVMSTSFDAGFPEASVTVRRGGSALTNGTNVAILVDNSVLRMEFAGVVRTLQGTYEVTVMNNDSSSSASFDLDVIYPPEFSGVELVTSTQLSSGSLFTFNCTPSATNPAPSFSFMRDGSTYTEPAGNINGPVLTISSVVRADTGNYSCTANNTAGSTTLYYNLLAVAPPTSPLNLMFSGEMAFSAMVTWTPPTDDGGISHPSWTPPSPSSSLIVQYTVTYSNSSGSWSISNLNTPLVTLSNLQHSTDYTVTVAASNAHGQSTGVQPGTFRTLDSKPILQAVVLAPLSLSNFTANVTFLTVGGQDVTSFSITINDSSPVVVDSTPVPDGKGVMVPLLIEGQSFTNGTYYTVEITATNSVGTSEPITGLMFVPNPPVITANFTEVFADDIPSTKCCAGVRLRLAEQPDVSNLKVLLTPQGGHQFTVNPADLSLEGSVLYIGGVQAGTNYTAVVTVSNIFGSSDYELQLKPLLGVPSNPNPPTVSVNGGQVTVELSTAYTGTVQTKSGTMFRFEIQFIEDSQRSSRQSKTEMLPVIPASLFNTSATFTTILDPGSYSVSVTAVNEHGRSSAVMSNSTSSVEGDVTIIIIIAIVVVVVLVLIVLIIAIICIICCKRIKKNKKEKYHVGSEDTELTTNRNAVEKNGLDGDRDSFVETGIYDEVGKETKKRPKPQSTPASTTNGQPQPGGDVYAEVNKPKKTNNAAATPTTPPTGDVYAAVDMSQKTKKPKIEAPADKVDPEATLYAEVVQEKKEPAVPPKTDAKYQNPEVDKPIEENELQYAALDFSKAPSSFKKPAPPNPDENVIYSEVTIAKKH